ncbi:hypothetical protein BJ508DRAFT_411412 [Ascobolus immersus RN42]|uniref:Biogenesis of lysosome-related organelles complex 1 subunit 2 n=1 Tax=Ascobolus immersus RN42 TaxID=1160509 RepID=A0A3N4IK48_ASCIM|nr:hypothetical protein BJ508DRAFT_411412 [Ascobolus immersus RN42]
MASPPNPAQAIAGVIGALQETFEVSTNLTVSDLDRLHEKNQSLAKHYSAMAKAAENLDQDAAELKAKYAEVEKYASKVDEIEERVTNLEEMIKELDGWTAELEQKVSRLPASRRAR